MVPTSEVMKRRLCSARFRTAITRRFHSLKANRGQALVGFALVIPILLMLVVGIMEIGRAAFVSVLTTNAARAGVQYGAQNHITALDNAGMRKAALDDAPTLKKMTVTPGHFCTCSDGGSSSCVSTDCTGQRMIEFVKVDTATPFSPLVNFPGLPQSYTLRGEAIMRIEQ